MVANQIFLKCRRTHNLIWKYEDVERYFEMSKGGTTQDPNPKTKKPSEYEFFMIQPEYRYGSQVDNKLSDTEDQIYFVLLGLKTSQESPYCVPEFVSYIKSRRQTVRFM